MAPAIARFRVLRYKKKVSQELKEGYLDLLKLFSFFFSFFSGIFRGVIKLVNDRNIVWITLIKQVVSTRIDN